MPEPVSLEDSTLHNLERCLLNAWPRQVWADRRSLLAVSGGADSVALARAMRRVSHRVDLIELAHYNHGWRGVESQQDEDFVCELGDSLGVHVHVGRAAVLSTTTMSKSEESARRARYKYFAEVAYKIGASFVLTAHTAGDRVETLLHNLFRGTGISGVRSMKLTRPLAEELLLVRPMLNVTRPEIETYLRELRQDYREDSSNTDQSYRRNFLRQSLLPSVRQEYGVGVDDRLLSFADILSEFDVMLCKMADDYWSQVQEMSKRDSLPGKLDTRSVALPSNQQLPMHWPVVHQALKKAWRERQWPLGKMRREHWDSIRQLHEGNCGSAASCKDAVWRVHGNLPGDLRLGTVGSWIVATSDSHQQRALFHE